MQELSKIVGFIGAGNMARAIVKGLLQAGQIQPHQVILSDAYPEQVARLSSETGAANAASNREVVEKSDVIILATKPFQVVDVCREVSDLARSSQLFISICAGVPTRRLEEALSGVPRVVRVMPNTPALVGCGSAGIAAGTSATKEDLSLAKQIFDSVGSSVIVSEEKLDLITGLTGSGPAYVFRFMEALIQAGTDLGLSDAEARILVPQMVLGSARMAVESGRALHELRDAVTTKGGTTEAGLRTLDEGDFMQLMLDCVAAATARSKELASA